MNVDAIVNTANPQPIIGKGVDSAIHKKAGKQLIEERKKIGDIAVGEACITDAFLLKAKYVIHTVGPIWNGGNAEIKKLEACYYNSLQLAKKYKCESIAFPMISSGAYGFPKEIVLETAINVISHFLMKNEMMIYLVVFDKASFCLSEKLFKKINSYIDERYVEENLVVDNERRRNNSYSLESMLKKVDCTFSEALFQLIIDKDLNEVDVYKKANMNRKLFSKIRNNKYYRPNKINAIALAIGMELNLNETKDLLAKAGYALSHSSQFDIIVEYFISQGRYNVFEINEVLFDFNQPLIGG